MELLRDGMLIWRRINITRRLMRYLNRTYLTWGNKLKGNRNTRWNEVPGMNIREVRVHKNHPVTIVRGKEDVDIESERDCICR